MLQISCPFSVTEVVPKSPSNSEALCNVRDNMFPLRTVIVSSSSKPPSGGPPLTGCPWLYSVYSQLLSISGGRSLHPEPEDAPCRGDRESHLYSTRIILHSISFLVLHWTGRIILDCGLDASGSEYEPVTDCCEHGIGPSGSMKGRKF